MSQNSSLIESHTKEWVERLVTAGEIVNVLATLPPDAIKASINAGDIHADMRLEDAVALQARSQS